MIFLSSVGNYCHWRNWMRVRTINFRFDLSCRKTTQIPQFLIESDPDAKVVVCQPRRLAAVGVATRVAWEQSSPVGEVTDSPIQLAHSPKVVGHSVKRLSKTSEKTRLLFCTYGVLLKRLQGDRLLNGVDYVILDEVIESFSPIILL
jgi:HrpA-like RNA helicase